MDLTRLRRETGSLPKGGRPGKAADHAAGGAEPGSTPAEGARPAAELADGLFKPGSGRRRAPPRGGPDTRASRRPGPQPSCPRARGAEEPSRGGGGRHGPGVCEQQAAAREGGGVRQAHLPLLPEGPGAARRAALQAGGSGICRHHGRRRHRQHPGLSGKAHGRQDGASGLYRKRLYRWLQRSDRNESEWGTVQEATADWSSAIIIEQTPG